MFTKVKVKATKLCIGWEELIDLYKQIKFKIIPISVSNEMSFT